MSTSAFIILAAVHDRNMITKSNYIIHRAFLVLLIPNNSTASNVNRGNFLNASIIRNLKAGLAQIRYSRIVEEAVDHGY